MGNVIIAEASPISIHALREEGDARATSALLLHVAFLSTPSARRATLILLWITC